MNYYLDAEFHEAFYKPYFGKRRHFIDLISIAIVSEAGEEYYAISKDFDVNRAWKDDWLRENVLRPMIRAEVMKFSGDRRNFILDRVEGKEDLAALKAIINQVGRSNNLIAKDIQEFTANDKTERKFYGYFCDYDWVLLCSLFGRMVDLPENYPMYCRDLKQMAVEIDESVNGDFDVSENPDYPIQAEGEHSAIEDARWNKKLHEFLIVFKKGLAAQ